jgi:YVTN family beta-propeller protein
LFEEVPVAAGLSETMTFTEPEAAAAHYAISRRLKDGQIVAVYDLGGGTFDATILRGGPEGVSILGRPEGIERLGGVDFDESILGYVNFSLDGILDGLDQVDPATASAVARLRQDCVLAKEALSADTETLIPVFLPGRHAEVRLTRGAFEDMIRAPLESTIDALLHTVRSADLKPSDLSAVLLVGGSSRIPLVAREISSQLGCKTMVDTHPKYAVAMGAAALAANAPGRPAEQATQPNLATAAPAAPPPQHAPPPARPPQFAGATARASGSPAGNRASAATEVSPGWPGRPPPPGSGPDSAGGASYPARPFEREPSTSGARGGLRRGWIVGAALLLVALVGVGYALLSGGHRGSIDRPGDTATADSAKGRSTAPAAPAAPTARFAASLATPTVSGSFPVAAAPQAAAITPDGKLAYVTSTATNSITIVDLASNATVGSIPVSAGPPQYVAFTPDGRYAYVSVYDQIRETGNVVVVVDTATRSIIASVPAKKFPYALAVTPDGRQLFIPNHDFPALTVVDTSTNTVTRQIPVKPSPHSVAFSGDASRAYVANHFSNLVTVLDTGNGAVLAEIPTGRSPHSIAMSPDGSVVYVVDYDGNTVTVIDPSTNAATATIPVGLEPQSVAFAPDSKHAYIVNDGNNTVSVIDTATNKVTAIVTVGQAPTDVVAAPDGKHAYVTNISSNDVTILNTG